jgi:hypothetical protein
LVKKSKERERVVLVTIPKYVHQKIDVSVESCLGICECGFRALETSKKDVMKLLATHTYRCHPGSNSPATRRKFARKLVSQ